MGLLCGGGEKGSGVCEDGNGMGVQRELDETHVIPGIILVMDILSHP